MQSNWKRRRWPASAISTIAMMSVLSVAQATTIDNWNRDNVVTDLPPHVPGVTYDSKLFIDTTRTETNGAVIWKEGSVVTPGSQVLTDSPEGSGRNCIITTGTDRSEPASPLKTCSDAFQSAKRVKLEARLAGTGDINPDPNGSIFLADGKPLDMVFEADDADNLARTYRVFKKYINGTGERMDAFVVELGFGTGDDFVESTDGDGLMFTKRKQGQNPNPNEFEPIPYYSTPPGDEDLGSLMSAGLFGLADFNQNRNIDGYFWVPEAEINGCPTDPSGTGRAYYDLVVRNEDVIETNGTVQGLHYCLYGNMLPQGGLPQGYFWDGDGDPVTDADTVADWVGDGDSQACNGTPCWQTYVVLDTDPNSTTFGQPILDQAGNFTRPAAPPVLVPQNVIDHWVANPDTGDGMTVFYFVTELDDMGLTNNNYHITVESIEDWPTYDPLTGTATFTMRTSNVGEGVPFDAPWLATQPPQIVEPLAADPSVLTLNFPSTVEAGQTVSLPVTVENTTNAANPASGQVIGEARDASGKLYFSFLGDFADLAPGTSTSFTFDWEVADPTGLPPTVTWTVTAYAAGEDLDLGNNTQTASVAIVGVDVALSALDVPGNAKTGRDYAASVTVSNVGDLSATGTVTVTANGDEVFSAGFDLEAGMTEEIPFTWTAPDVSKKLTVTWNAMASVDGGDSDPSDNEITLQTKVTPGGGGK